MSRAVWRQADAVTESGVVRDAAYGEPLGRVGALLDRRYPREVLADSPAGYWRLGEASGTQAFDASGNGRHGTRTADVTVGAQGLLEGDTDTAYAFDGTATANDDVTLPAFALGDNWSWEIWIHPDSLPLVTSTGVLGRPNNPRIQWSDFSGNPRLMLFASRTPAGTGVSATSPDLDIDETYHVVAVAKDATTTDCRLELWINGDLAASAEPASAINLTTGSNLYINRRDSTRAFSGSMDEAAVYAHALTEERIAAHYAARLLEGQPALTLAVPDLGAQSFGAALGFAPLYDSAALPAGEYVVYDRRDDADNRVTLAYERPENRWALHRYAGGSDDPLYVADTFTAGTVKHLAIGGDAEHLYLQVDGGTRTEGENAMPLVLTSTAHDIGQAGGLGALPAVYAYAIPYWRAYTEAEGAHFASLTRPPHTGDVPRVVLP